jgi:hypothetical protein
MTLQPWRRIMSPRQEIADGTFGESQFASDLGLVEHGTAAPEYQQPARFFEQTYLTDPLRDVLLQLAERLGGNPAARAVYWMRTDFGGGKTHTLLAAYHLFRDPAQVAATDAARKLGEQHGNRPIPKVTVVVLDGSALSADPEPLGGGATAWSLLGHLAWRLGRGPAFARVAAEDVARAGTSTLRLIELLREHTPCLILLDETLQYLAKASNVPVGDGSLATATLTIIRELSSAVAAVPGAALVVTASNIPLADPASLPMAGMRDRLEDAVGRVQSIVVPVEGDDVFPILRRRLFKSTASDEDRRAAAIAFSAYYEQVMGDALPTPYRDAPYRERLTAAYPFHPELIDILTERWGSIPSFHRTRGALRLLAHTVKALCWNDHQGPLILPGDLDLSDQGVQNEVLQAVADGFRAALISDISRDDANAPQVDRECGGQAQELRLGTRLATTAFLYSHGSARALGANQAELLVGVGQPGLSRGLIEDVRDRLERKLWHLRLEGGHYRFTVKGNLNKMVLEREPAVGDDRVEDLLVRTIPAVIRSTRVLRVEPRVREPRDLPDTARLTLAVLNPRIQFGGDTTVETMRVAEEILRNTGNGFRAYTNATMLVAADAGELARARATARRLLALRDIRDDPTRYGALATELQEELQGRITQEEQRFPKRVAAAWRHLFELRPRTTGGAGSTLAHEDLRLGLDGLGVTEAVVELLRRMDRLIDMLAPTALVSERFNLLPEGIEAVELDTVLAAFARYPTLPKLTSQEVLRRSIAEGAQRGLFGLASGASWDAGDAILRFREPVVLEEIAFQPGVFLVRASAAESLVQARAGKAATDRPDSGQGATGVRDDHEERKEAKKDVDDENHQARYDHLTVEAARVPGGDVLKLVRSVMGQLNESGVSVRVVLSVRAEGAITGDARALIQEGVQQLGLQEVRIEFG